MRKPLALLVPIALATPAFGAANLVITEIWAGQSGTDLTGDWFEVTNIGDMAYDLASNPLFYDDDSANPTADSPLGGISTISAGESVVFVASGPIDAANFSLLWGISAVQVGYYDGAGLGQGGDAVFLFDGNTVGANTIASGVVAAQINDAYSVVIDPSNLGGPLSEVALGTFGTFQSAVAGGDLGDVFAVGSPGRLPAPAGVALMGIAGFGVARRRR